MPYNKVEVKVLGGWVTLEGNLKYQYQKQTAGDIAGNIRGVRGVMNEIKILSNLHDAIEKSAIEQAFERNWATGDCEIHVKVVGNRVILYGMVNSLYQRDEAGKMALNAPGVKSIDNQLFVGYDD